jgi:hypothetical protein
LAACDPGPCRLWRLVPYSIGDSKSPTWCVCWGAQASGGSPRCCGSEGSPGTTARSTRTAIRSWRRRSLSSRRHSHVYARGARGTRRGRSLSAGARSRLCSASRAEWWATGRGLRAGRFWGRIREGLYGRALAGRTGRVQARDHHTAGSVGGSRLGMGVGTTRRRYPPLLCVCGRWPLRVNCNVLNRQVPRLHRQAQPKIQRKRSEQTIDSTTWERVRCDSLGPEPAPAC